MSRVATGERVGPAEVREMLLAAENVCDQRKGADLAELMAHGEGEWAGRLAVTGVGAGAGRSLVLGCRLGARGLVWADAQAVVREGFEFEITLPPRYPLAMPGLRFRRPVPMNPHVVHEDFLPAREGLPLELHEHLRQGHGVCCFLSADQWAADSGSLTLVAWQVARIVTLATSHGEEASLNPVARDLTLRLAEEDRLPLGPSLPWPGAGGAGATGAPTVGAEEGDVSWEVEE